MALRKRCQVFLDLLDSGRIGEYGVDYENTDELVKLLDAAVIKMEGGSDNDLKVLDQTDDDRMEGNRSRNNSESVSVDRSPEKDKRRKSRESTDRKPDEPLKLPISAEQKELMKKAQEFSKQQLEKNGNDVSPKAEKKQRQKRGKKRHRDKTEYSYESGSESESITGSESDSEPAPPGLEEDGEAQMDEGEEPINQEASTKSREVEKEKKGNEDDEDNDDDDDKDVDTKESKEEKGEESGASKPRCLHKTCSIFLRNLAPTITKQEVEAMCKRYPGFMRVALQDPQPERRFFRRGWVTFEREVNIKEICWNLNNIRLRECELGATLNRELKQRIRPVNGISSHKQIARADIKLAAKIIQNLDSKWGIWDEPEEEKQDSSKEATFNFGSKNPILKNITDYLVEEGSFEEEELMGESMDEKEKDTSNEVIVERDEGMLKALNKMVLYLRIVHSVDYYSANEYPNEDEMPHRCGIMHCRGVAPTTKITQQDVNDWIANFENKLKQFTERKEKLDDEAVIKLGKKDPNAEVEKFVTANTQELSKDKWLCPISGKKFKGPEFVRKHIFNKHGEKVEEVKIEVTFFNNYLSDPKRPALPEHPKNKQPTKPERPKGDHYSSPGGMGGGFQGHPQQGMMGGYSQRGSHMMGYGNSGVGGHYGSHGGGFGGGRDYPPDYSRRLGGHSRNFRSNSFMKRNTDQLSNLVMNKNCVFPRKEEQNSLNSVHISYYLS